MKKVLLIILDGWGLTPKGKEEASAIAKANTLFIDKIWKENPHCQLKTHGMAVGLPEGQMGNSQVGHLNLGAGRIVYQDLMKINLSIESKELNKNETLLKAFQHTKEKKRPLHILGVLSDGGIHGHINHIKALTTIARENDVKEVYIHAFTDGRDTDPKSGINFLKELKTHLDKTAGQIATITGRYYAMDRDTRWERTALAYHAMVNGEGERTPNLEQAVQNSYKKKITDEFIEPIIHVDKQGNPLTTIQDGDAVIFSNFRSDRARQMTEALTQKDFPDQKMKKLDLFFIPFKKYDEEYKGLNPLFEDTSMNNVMGEVLSKHNKTQLRIAETEKYAHVTYFFNNGREESFIGENRIIVPSPRDVKNYNEKPEMSAYQVKDKVIEYMNEYRPDFICLNFANPDMVGHTGDFEATVEACQVVDECTKEVVENALKNNYITMVLADHGNADYMKNEDGSPNTNHTINPVPCILLGNGVDYKIKDGKLSDIAPTILKIMDIAIPKEMTGEILTSKVKQTQYHSD